MGLLTVSVIKWGRYLSSRVPFSGDEWNATFSGSFWQNPICGQCQDVYKGAGLCALGTRVHFRSAPGRCGAQALAKNCLDTKCLNIDAREINVMWGGREVSPKLRRENENLAFGPGLGAPLPPRPSGQRVETCLEAWNLFWNHLGTITAPSCWWILVFITQRGTKVQLLPPTSIAASLPGLATIHGGGREGIVIFVFYGETEPQEGIVMCPRPHGQQGVKLGFEFRYFDSLKVLSTEYLLWGKRCAKGLVWRVCFVTEGAKPPYEVDAILICIFQMRRLKLREVKPLACGHLATKWQSRQTMSQTYFPDCFASSRCLTISKTQNCFSQTLIFTKTHDTDKADFIALIL